MDHVAIMKRSWKLIPKIVSGEKTIESRRYQTRRAPWNTIHAGDTIYFKNTGEFVTAKAIVKKVTQYELHNIADAISLVTLYGDAICLLEKDPRKRGKIPKYCILMWLERAQYVEPFSICKDGFGSACAWLSVGNVELIQ